MQAVLRQLSAVIHNVSPSIQTTTVKTVMWLMSLNHTKAKSPSQRIRGPIAREKTRIEAENTAYQRIIRPKCYRLLRTISRGGNDRRNCAVVLADNKRRANNGKKPLTDKLFTALVCLPLSRDARRLKTCCG